MKKSFLLYVLLHLSWSFSQITFYQDIYNGGICITGTATGLASSGFTTLPLYIEPGSSIRKVFLITCEITHSTVNTEDYNIIINGVPFNQNQTDNYLFFSQNLINGNLYTGNRTHISDITDEIVLLGNNLSILMNPQTINQTCPACHYSAPMVVILYENNSLNPINILLAINDKPQNQINSLQINGFNSVNINNDIGMGIHSDRLGGNDNDGYEYFIDNQYLGLNNQQDITSIGGGAVGTFYYQNSTLTGLTDDIPNNSLSGSDAIIILNGFVNNDLNPMNIEYKYIQNTNSMHNNLIGLYFAYTSPCSAFATQTSSDTTLYFGTTAQLLASGGGLGGTLPAYEWQPAVGLSCTDCPNPIVTADSSRLYTVRIRNNNSCSVVRPIKVNVKPLPEFSSVVSKPSICGAATGQILLGADYVGETYSINGGTPQTSGTFSNLSAGTYTVSLHELNGCTRDTLVVVGDTSITQAYFTATPQSGAAPLWVQFSNQNTNANDFSWSVNGEPQGGNLSSFTFDTNGVYTVELVAWQFDPSCADTFSVLISVYDSLVVQIPNVFTPNHDGNNDFFGVTVNRPCAISFSILNRWGNVIQSGTVPALGGFVPLWSGSNAPDGTYFYQIELQADDLKQVEKRQGFVELRE